MKLKVCENYGGEVERKLIDYTLLGINLGKFEAEVCTKCKEEVFDEQVFDKIESKAKESRLWNLSDI